MQQSAAALRPTTPESCCSATCGHRGMWRGWRGAGGRGCQVVPSEWQVVVPEHEDQAKKEGGSDPADGFISGLCRGPPTPSDLTETLGNSFEVLMKCLVRL